MKNALTIALTAIFSLAALSGCCTAKKKACPAPATSCCTSGMAK